MTAPAYTTGSLKQDAASGVVALCTSLQNLDTSGGHDWFCLTTVNGSYYCDESHVETWPDIYTAP